MSDKPSPRYPGILDASAAVLIRAEPGEKLTPELVQRALLMRSDFPLIQSAFEMIRSDLHQAHMLDEDGRLTPLADKFGDLYRQWLAKTARDAP